MTTTALRPRKSLPILSNLDDLRIASPCDADWEGMQALTDDAGARARFCGSCEKNVYDLSAMTRDDAMQLIERHEGRCCVRFYQREDGTVLTEDCPVGVRALLKKAERRALLAAAATVGAVAAFVALLLGAMNPISRRIQNFIPDVPDHQVMGEMAEEPMPPPPPVRMGAPRMTPPTPDPGHVTMGKMEAPPKAVKGRMVRPQPVMGDMVAPID